MQRILYKNKKRIIIFLSIMVFFVIGLTYFFIRNSQEVDALNISSNTVWDISGSPYTFSENVQIDAGVTLTIDSGVEVRFTGDYYFDVRGTLDVNGSSGSEVLFTHDTSTSAASWEGIRVQGGGTATIDYAQIYYADKGFRISDTGLSAIVRDTVIDTNHVGIEVYERGAITTEMNTFSNSNAYPLGLNFDVVQANLGTRTDADTFRDGNNKQSIGIGYSDNSTNNCESNACQIGPKTFGGISNISYVINSDLFFEGSDDELEIEAGKIIKGWSYNHEIYINNGAQLDINKVSGNEVVFTSLKDDTVGNDTNNVGSATSSSKGDTDSWFLV